MLPGEHWRLPAGTVTPAQDLVRQALDGYPVAFVSAGISQGAGMPSWAGLLENLDEPAWPPDRRRGAAGAPGDGR